MESLNPRNTEKEEDLKEPLLDKQSTIDILERSRERGTASEQIIIYIPDDLEPDPDYTCCIQKVPEKLRRICPEAYTPQLVSIGPIHYGKTNLKAMELCKAKYEEAFWNRNFCKHIQDGTAFMKTNGWLAKFQRSYAVTIHSVDSLHFERMILRDACFILELFLRNCEIRLHNINIPSDARFKLHQDIKDHQKDCILRRPWLKAAIKQDLILLENQLPYFVFTDLLNSILKNKPANTFLPSLIADQESEGREDLDASIKKIACEFFIDYYKFGKPPAAGAVAATIADADVAAKGTFLDIHPRNVDMKDKSKEIISCDNFRSIKHFTDLVRRFMRPVALNNENFKGNGVHCLYPVTQLDSAGVNFVRSENENATLTDIKPKDESCCWWNGRCCCWIQGCCKVKCLDVEVPELKVQDDTECIFRNVMALEQFVYPRDPYICNYVFLLDQLISTEEDVQFLVDKKIVSNWLGSNKEVVDMINKLCDQIIVVDFFYNKLCEELNTHHDTGLNVFRATLSRVFFKDLWTKCSTAVAIVFLIFSILSTISTIKDLFF